MSARTPKVYRFATGAQWQRCLLHRFDATQDGLVPITRLAGQARSVADGLVTAVAMDHEGSFWRLEDPVAGPQLLRRDDAGRVRGPFELDQTLAGSRRLIVDRDWLWAFVFEGSLVRRYDCDSQQADLTIDLRTICNAAGDLVILDIAPDGRGGVWLLTRWADGTYRLERLDCEGRLRAGRPVPQEACDPTQLGSVNRGRQLAILAAHGRRLVLMDASDGAVRRVLDLGAIRDGWAPTRLSADSRGRIGLWGESEQRDDLTALVVLDAAGDAVDGPLTNLFAGDAVSPALGAADRPRVLDLAVAGNVVWLATSRGLWSLGGAAPGGSAVLRSSESTLLTPVLESLESGTNRGWLRAEITTDLPPGATITTAFASTNDSRVVEWLTQLAADQSATAGQRLQRVWAELNHLPGRELTVGGSAGSGIPVAIPLFAAQERWLWLRLHVVTPPGTEPARIRELRVFYPELSIDRDIPPAFKGAKNDPGAVLRRLVGVLETTTQNIDQRIRSIGSCFDPDTAPDDWLDYLGRWLDLPWDDGLSPGAKRRVLRHAGQLLSLRGTRAGLALLMSSLLGAGGSATLAEVTVDFPPIRLGKAPLPALLAGMPRRTATLGAKAVVGRARLPCVGTRPDPLDDIVPTLAIRVTAARETHGQLRAVLERILRQYIPAGIMLRIRWHIAAPFEAGATDGDRLILDGDGPGALGETSRIGRTVVTGRGRGLIDEAGLETALRLT